MQSLADIFAEEEARRIAEANSPEALARENALYEARMAAPLPGRLRQDPRRVRMPRRRAGGRRRRMRILRRDPDPGLRVRPMR